MPIFEYKCEECGGRFEKLVRRPEDESELACPLCGEPRVTKQLSTFSPHAGGSAPERLPMCPGGGPCPTPGACGMN